jgi:ParB family transcriptional regulator, chromosome partitioning protein
MSTYGIGDSLSILDIEDIQVGINIENIRTVFDEGKIKELAESIYEDGLINPLVVMDTEDPDTGDDIVELVCGARRLRAIRYIQKHMDAAWNNGEVKCSQFEGGLPDAELLNGMENIERAEVDDIDTAAWLFRMVEDSGHTQADLAKKTHKSPTWVSTRITFHRNACDELKQALREGIINFTAAYQLASKLSHEEQKKRVQRARTHNEKITLEAAERAGNDDKTQRPGKKEREKLQKLAEKLSMEDPIKYRNAHGVAMALRFVDGLLTSEEMEEIIKWDEPPEAAAPASPPTDEEDGEE